MSYIILMLLIPVTCNIWTQRSRHDEMMHEIITLKQRIAALEKAGRAAPPSDGA